MRTSADRGSARCLLLGGLMGLAGLVLAACTTSSSGGPSAFLMGHPKVPDSALPATPVAAYCPPLMLRGGTESITVYDHGHDGDPASVRYQASITKNARECSQGDGTLTVKVGLSGNVVGGPKGSAGALALPLRIAVVKQSNEGGKPLFSQLFKIPASLTAPSLRADYSFVQSVTFKVTPDDRDLIVYAGFDEGKKPPTPPAAN